MGNQKLLGVAIGPRKVGAAAGAATFCLFVGAGYWLWGTPALLVGIGLLQLATVLAVAHNQVAQQRQTKATRARTKELDGRLRRLGERVDAIQQSWSSKATELATTADMAAMAEKLDAAERTWTSMASELATSKDLAAHTEAVSRSVGSELHQTTGAMAERLATWRSEERDHAEKLAQRRKKDHYHEYRQVESLAALYYGVRPRQPLPPTRSWTASPDFLYFLYDLVRTERPKRIVECGSGLSTVVMAYALENNGSGSIISLEHLDEYLSKTQALLREHKVERFVDLREAPLQVRSVGDESYQWYDFDAEAEECCDLLLVDGPPRATQPHARYPAVPLLRGVLTEHAIVVLDDYDRRDEREVAQRWVDECPEYSLTRLNHEKGTAFLRRSPQ